MNPVDYNRKRNFLMGARAGAPLILVVFAVAAFFLLMPTGAGFIIAAAFFAIASLCVREYLSHRIQLLYEKQLRSSILLSLRDDARD